MTVAVTDFLAAKKSEGISAAAYSHYKKWLGRFSAAFGARQVSSITRDEILPWLATLGLGDVTTHGHFVRVRSLFTWLVNIGKLARNPCNGIKAPKITPEDVEVLTVTDGGKLFIATKIGLVISYPQRHRQGEGTPVAAMPNRVGSPQAS